MDPRLRKLLVALGISAALVSGGVFVNSLLPKAMTYEEYTAYLAMMNYEIERAGGTLTVADVHGDAIQKIEALITAREVTEDTVTLDGETLSKSEYMALRKELIGRRK